MPKLGEYHQDSDECHDISFTVFAVVIIVMQANTHCDECNTKSMQGYAQSCTLATTQCYCSHVR